MALRDWTWNPFARPEVEIPPVLASALGDLDRLAGGRPELATAARSLAGVLRAAFIAPVPDISLLAEPELIVAAWRSGVPAFRAGDVPPALDRDDLQTRALAIVSELADDHPRSPILRAALRDGSADIHAWALMALAGDDGAIDEQAIALGIDAPRLRAVLRLTLLPVLARVSESLAVLRPEGVWTRGDCPNCGSPPVLAESRGLEQRRYWRCGLCASDWAGERLRCPFCGETDHRRLHYRFAEGEQDRHRLAICDICEGRLKVVSTLAPISAPGLLIAELATVHLEGDESLS